MYEQDLELNNLQGLKTFAIKPNEPNVRQLIVTWNLYYSLNLFIRLCLMLAQN